jgi:hypothetical protein
MAMVVESSTQIRLVVKHTFFELVEDDEFGVRSQTARHRASSEPRKFSDHMVQFDTCDVEQKSVASTQANDTDDDTELMLSDEEPLSLPQAPPGVFTQAQPQNFVPVCVAFVPVMQQPLLKKSSRSARRRRARAMNRWFRYNMQGEQQDGAFNDLDAEFDDEWQLPESDAESPETDAAESWPMPNSSPEVQHDKKKA